MWQLIVKVLVTAVIVVAVAEIAKRSSFWGGVLASLPLTSLLAFIWIYLENKDVEVVADLSRSIFWLVLPSLGLFLILPYLLRSGWSFWAALALSCGGTAVAYFAMVWFLEKIGVQL